MARLRVKDDIYRWSPGKCVIFDDSFEHEVWQDGETERIVLVADIPHPLLPEKVHRQQLRGLSPSEYDSRVLSDYTHRKAALETFLAEEDGQETDESRDKETHSDFWG